MYSKLLPAVSKSVGSLELSSSDELKMVVAIHRVMPPQISYDALAAMLLSLLIQQKEDENGEISARQRGQWLNKVRAVIRALAVEIAPDFDGCALMRSFLSFDVSGASCASRDEEDKARLMFQCVTMHASLLAQTETEGTKSRQPTENGWSPSTKTKVRTSLFSARKSLLSWCCVDYGPHCASQLENRRRPLSGESLDLAGAGAPNFHSCLGSSHGEEKIPSWLNIMRCLLFLEEADSSLMKQFVQPEGYSLEDENELVQELARIRLCCDYGAGVNDEMIWIVIRASTSSRGALPPRVAIELLENLFECCAESRAGSLSVNDPTIVWELYGLVEYTPPESACAVDSQNDEPEPETRNVEELPR